ncbi:hypothetical protein Cgig2_022709 [Carnegiea gigantea]|uniref:Uncharacterized protein n=1 Tax=Carnegiea gigantea TaxID=171969 RepID=A0A9Q1QE35_9CARY|nr:hypothetical protein Cgig2_022709 [Carnegiea gigantea]
MGYQKAQIQKLSQVMATRELKKLVEPTMKFGSEVMYPLQTPHNDALVTQLMTATTMVRQILVDTGSYVDIITLEFLKKLQYNEKHLEVIEAPIVGLQEQATYPLAAKRLPTLNAMKVLVAPDLPLIQFKLDDEKLYRDQKITRECYYISLQSFGRKEYPPIGEMLRPNKTRKKVTTEAMVVLSASVEEHERPRLEPTSELVFIPFNIVCLALTVQISKDLDPTIKDGIAKLLE